MQKWFYIIFCEGTNYYVDSVLLDTYYITGVRHMNVPVLLNTYYISRLLDTYYTLCYLAHEYS